MSYNRRMEVLHAIVSDYVKTREPVASKTLVERYKFGVSPATIRNDMVILEEQGLIHQPHTSAGRVPTDAGYRVFVDQIAEIKPLSSVQRNAISTFLSDATDIQDVVERSVKLLAQLTNQVAVVQYPSIRKVNLKHIEMLLLSPNKIMFIFITTNGYVSRRVIETTMPVKQEALDSLKLKLNIACTGVESSQIIISLEDLNRTLHPNEQHIVQGLKQIILDILTIDSEEKLVTAGSSNLVKVDDDFNNSIVPVLDALEEQVVLLRLFSQMNNDKKVEVSIGVENQCEDLLETSVVAGAYGTTEAKAHISIIGPKRMDYAKNMAAVETVCKHLSEHLSQNG
ncbi:heat-inducible transcriptional repressor HrcA [Actinomyces sp. zg-332]|uniref:heat-inducible transcriptional repressor HrcA n=1 Tax=Actinomyces sp. zg-332 TaxID=2708340 RepID=UPI00142332B2|nr:heat-inducible transcriptional repressor HrcA [Actinomyces sp. zg-332]QPK94483.1 heat-inducible transcriptional repressor HrcA [Actinomyces sp. zg-332]